MRLIRRNRAAGLGGLAGVVCMAIGAGATGGCAADGSRPDRTGGGLTVGGDTPASTAGAEASVLDHRVLTIDGEPQNLTDYRGQVVLIVNTASQCGFTRQYAGLQDLYQQRRDRGFVVLGFPANDFMGQEPGSNEQIAAFCEAEYGVTFPLFAKISVKGEEQHPLFAELAAESEEPTWNFTKYLVDRQGRLVQRFGPRVEPTDKALTNLIDGLLADTTG